MERIKRFIKTMIGIIRRPEMGFLPGQLAFFLLMTLIPMAALLGAIASQLSISVTTLEGIMKGVLPNTVITFIIDIINGKGPNLNIVIFFASAFVLASNGPHSMIIVSNEIYKIKHRNYAIRRLKALFMTFIMSGLFLVLFLIPIFGTYIMSLVENNISNQAIVHAITGLYQILKYPTLVIVLHFNIKLLYIIAPDEHIKSMTTTRGAIFTTVLWIIATEVYSFYIGAFTSYNMFYGSISNVLILILWIYILSYIFVIGLIINAGTYREVTQVLKVIDE